MRKVEEDLRALINQSFQRKFSFVSSEEMWHPLTDVYQAGTEIIIRMELPGVDVRDLQVMIQKGNVIVQGVRKDQRREEQVCYHRMEISYGPFRRIIALPGSIRTKGTRANFKDGFLEIKLPVSSQVSCENASIDIE